MQNHKNGIIGDAELGCQVTLCVISSGIKFSYFLHKNFCQFCIHARTASRDTLRVFTQSLSIPRWMIPSALVLAIASVIFARAEEQVGRSHARWIVTMVANAHTGGWVSMDKNPREPVSTDQSSLKTDVSISILVSGVYPFPARINLLDLCPKPFWESRVIPTTINSCQPMGESERVSFANADNTPTKCRAISTPWLVGDEVGATALIGTNSFVGHINIMSYGINGIKSDLAETEK
jgi:hypothetical protein